MDRPALTHLFLRLFVVSVAVNAALGIVALLIGDFGATEGRILGTSFLVSAAMLSVLVNAPAMARRALWPAPLVGAGAAVIALAQFIVMVWADVESENWLKEAFSFLVVAGGATLAANLSLVRLPSRYRLTLPGTVVLIALLVVIVVFAIWGEPGGDWCGRLIGVVSVLVAAGTLLIPTLSRFAPPGEGAGLARGRAGPIEPAARFCPSCGRPVAEQPLGAAATCANCGLGFEVLEAAPALDPELPGP